MLHQYVRSIINIDDSFNKSLSGSIVRKNDNKQQHVISVTGFDWLHEDVRILLILVIAHII